MVSCRPVYIPPFVVTPLSIHLGGGAGSAHVFYFFMPKVSEFGILGDIGAGDLALKFSSIVKADIPILTLRNPEGKELGRFAGSAKGKPKIETYNPAADSTLGQLKKAEEAPVKDKKEKKKKKKKDAEEEDTAVSDNGNADDDEPLKKEKRKKKKHSAEDVEVQNEGENGDAGEKKKKKRKHAVEEESETPSKKKEKKKKKKSDE
ncbi:hypothetical protein TIFTF001_000443 [Ficus carica]|uniref:Uncharacterized protein n=1 Tax=Ficus carica TaxID=3494 RepID=A0AA88D1B9_FICCA|nr:hypothetical protein TIFTF001_000443 [Ficus carica]